MDADKIRNVLNIAFIVLTLAAIVLYFKESTDVRPFFYVCGAAIVVKIIEVFIRFTNRK